MGVSLFNLGSINVFADMVKIDDGLSLQVEIRLMEFTI